MRKRGNVTSHNIQEYSKCLFQKAASFSEASLVVLVVHNRPANTGDAREAVLIPGLEDPWRRKWHPTPVFLPGKSHGQRSLAGYSPWGHKESDRI